MKRYLLTLVALLAMTTGAWADDINISPTSGDISTILQEAKANVTSVGDITINLKAGVTYTVSSAMEIPAGLTINGNGATINAESLTEAYGMFFGTDKSSATKADIKISDLTIKSLNKSLYYSNGENNYGDFIMDNCLVEVTSSVIVFNYTRGSAVTNLTLTNSTFYAPTNPTTTQFYSSAAGQPLNNISSGATQKFSFQNCTLYNFAKGKAFFTHRKNSQSWQSYEAKNTIFVDCGKSGQVVIGMNGGYAGANPTWSIDGNLFNYDGADTSASETTGDTSEGESVQNSVTGVVTFKDPSKGDFSGTITKSDNSTVDLTLGDKRWTTPAGPKVTYNDGKTEATFAMPACDATVSYQLVRDMSESVNFLGIPTGNGATVKKDGDKYTFATAPIITLSDVLNPSEAISIFYYNDGFSYVESGLTLNVYPMVEMEGKWKADETATPVALADFLASPQPGRWMIKATAETGPYDGTLYSPEFTLAEAYDLTLSPATDANLKSVTVAGTAKTADENGVIKNIEPTKKVKITTTGPDYIIRKATVKKTGAAATLLAPALVNGATIEVVCESNNGIQMGGNFTYNDGVFTRNNFVGNALYINQMKATATVSGSTITIATGIGDYSDFDHNVMLNTSDDTYTLTGGSSIGSVVSVKVNGVEILDKLTKVE